ncbi:hypothetical protein C1646_777859 [Rhizophagus diaphanus]|nr:hypothetical protein C1646_777859 [Rhizophagus diaphanus] [Rhizophagus sp. MUCL 43196]
MDFKQAINKSNSEVTKFYKKIELFTKVFNLLPPGVWAVCDIPLTYWILIYREFWEEIIICELDLSQEKDEEEDDDDEVEEVEEEFEEIDVDDEVGVIEIYE